MTDHTHPQPPHHPGHLTNESERVEPSAVDPMEFPMEFPIKVMGKNEADFTPFVAGIREILTGSFVAGVIARHVPDFDPSSLEARESKGGAYLSLTATFTAQSREQLDALYRELSASPKVSYLI